MASSLTDSAAPRASLRPRSALAVWSLAKREWVRFVRQPNRVFGAIGQPVIFWLLFGVGLGPSFRLQGAEGHVTYREYFFPGSLVLILLFTAIFATISIIEDRREGFLQSVLVSPMSRWAMVLGKVLGGSWIALAQGLLFLLLGMTVGIQFTLPMLAMLTVFLFVLALALTSLGFVIAWRLDSTQGFHAIMSVLLLPMWLLSGAFFPAPLPSATATLAERALACVIWLNPLTYGVAGVRQLLYHGASGAGIPPGTPGMVTCWLVTLGFALAAFAVAWKTAGRRTRGDLL